MAAAAPTVGASKLLRRLQAAGHVDRVSPELWRAVNDYLARPTFVDPTPEALASLCGWWKRHGAVLVGRSDPPARDPSDVERWRRVVRSGTCGVGAATGDDAAAAWPAGHEKVRSLLGSDVALMREDDATLIALLEQCGIAPEDCAGCVALLRADHARLRKTRRALLGETTTAAAVRFDAAPRLLLGGKYSVAGFEAALPEVGRAIRRDRQTRRMLRDWVRRRASTTSVAATDQQRYLQRVGRRWEQVARDLLSGSRAATAALRDICEDFVAAGLRAVGVWNEEEDPGSLRAAWDYASTDSTGVRLCHWFGVPTSQRPSIRSDPDVLLSDDPSTAIVFPRHRSWPEHLWPVKLLLCRRAHRTREIYEDLLERWVSYVVRVCRLPVHDDDDETHPFVRALFVRHDSFASVAAARGSSRGGASAAHDF